MNRSTFLISALLALLAGCAGLDVDREGDDDTSAPSSPVDADGDGYTTPGDCDDRATDANADGRIDGFFTHPDAPEICDGADNDCDSQVDEELPTEPYYVDVDNDGYGVGETVGLCATPESGYASVNGDCNDTDPAFHPGAEDVAGDGYDTDCDDETVPADDSTGDEPEKEPKGDDDSTPKGDDDTSSGDDDDTTSGDDDVTGDDDTSEPEPATDADADGYTDTVDCDEGDPEVNPGAAETCGDGLDNDCSGGDADCESPDSDSDGSTDDVDCDDEEATVYPGATETADGLDNDCDTVIDEGTSAYDDDGDGSTETGGDCDDNDAAVHPGATELCDGDDQDCDGQVDEGFDADGDGYSTCEVDCDDNDAAVNPSASEYSAGIDGEDNDCDEQIDEDWQATVEVTYPSSGYYVLNAGFYTTGATPNSLGWTETYTQTSGTDMSVEFTTSEYGDMSGTCGLIVNVNEGNPNTSWFCQNWEVDSAVFIDAWVDGVWYDETNVQEWIADEATGSCAAVIQTDSRSACDPVDDE